MNEPLFNISRESLKNAVREVISEKIDKDYIDCCIDGLIDEQKVKINRKVDEMIDGITVEQTRVDQWISRKMDRDMESKVRDAVVRQAKRLIKESVELAVLQTVKNGIEVQIGGSWDHKTTLKTSVQQDPSQDRASRLLSMMKEEFPGLWDSEQGVCSGELAEWLTEQIKENIPGKTQ